MLTVPGKDRILGVTIVGEHAGDLLAEFVLAMKHGLGLNKILGTIHIYPTWPRPTSTPPATGSGRTRRRDCCARWSDSTPGCAAELSSMPALNEAAGIRAALEALAPLRARGHEVIVVDGGSDDGTPSWPRPLCDRAGQPRRAAARCR